MRSLLLLVDLQRDYLASPGLEPPAGEVVRRAARLLDGCRRSAVPVAHVWTTVSRDDDRRMPHWRRDGRWLCEQGTPGHAPGPGLEPRRDETVVHKTSYSAFATGDADRRLPSRGVDRVIVAGVHLHGCVRQAVLDLYERTNAEILVAEDATASDDPVHAAVTRRYLERRAARFLRVDEILAELGAPAMPTPGAKAEAAVRNGARRSRAALPAWVGTEAAGRAALLDRAAARLEPRADELAHEMAEAIGKPVRYGTAEVHRAAAMLRAVARHARDPHAPPSGNGAAVPRRPLGVVAAVTPWNNPIYIPLGKIAPALAFGNAVVWKPAPVAFAVADRVERLLADAGVPPGLVTVVRGGRDAALAAMSDPGIDAVALTGSSSAGFSAQEVCARRRVPLQAELGGNNAALVWHDADLEAAATEIAAGAFALAGQRCTANRRVVVHSAVRGPLLELLERETAALAWGDPRSPLTHVGPLVSTSERDRVAELVSRATDVADPIVPHGGTPPADAGFDGAWYPPTIITCDDPSHELVQEETFGPLLVVQTAEDWDRAIGLVNGVRQGLVASVFVRDEGLAARFPIEAEAGIVKLNRSTADAAVDVPFGGWKASGIGPPEHGVFDRDFYTRPQVVYR